jgi:hypothetical protein
MALTTTNEDAPTLRIVFTTTEGEGKMLVIEDDSFGRTRSASTGFRRSEMCRKKTGNAERSNGIRARPSLFRDCSKRSVLSSSSA